ncbi:tripartite tricarboxylate transporter permease [Rhizobium sp. TRM95111]|uniref:tripartite tricarboxylate transporter permease n=1 Tax=Rhizobium alarense TaxID=2846851 RepID=UPI001F3F3011|nr:tripartite tricarboxylate transporter permease [Rhizobium alarense]MCF3639805.1 tripartite tricarboxylate transporter permease [Rhizobium alarense]
MDPTTILSGLSEAMTLTTFLFVVAGVALGQVVGAIPGLSAPMAIAIAVPFTFTLSPLAAIAFLIGVGKGGTVGGAIPAVLLNTPGTPDAAATALDGHPLARAGKPLKAMKMALYASITGDTFSDIVLILVAAPLAVVALAMGPVEITALIVLSIAIITGLVGPSMAKGLIAAGLGILCASIGIDPEHGTPRLIFGNYDLYNGLPISAVAVGMLAMGEILTQLATRHGAANAPLPVDLDSPAENRRISWAEYWGCRVTIARGAVIGTVVGALPGLGSTVAAFLSYGMARSASKEPESFGKGNLNGIAACESANSAVMGANMIPLLTLGIPGNVTAALIIGAFMVQGIQPGPLLFQSQGKLIYGLFGAMILANLVNFLVGLVGLRLWAKVIAAPASVIFPLTFLLCITGVYVAEGGAIAVWILIGFGVLSVLMQAAGLPIVAFIIMFVLATQLELSLSQALTILGGNPLNLLHHPVALALLALSLLSVWIFGIRAPARAPRRSVSEA